MTLTLVQLAQAITEGKTIEGFVCGEWTTDILTATIFERWCLESTYVRIKPEPREYWMVSGHSFPSRKDAEIYRAQGRFESIIHVREVL
ncbi:hypothetical protein N9878_01660 [bacterium]|nr:hypothetical protein [bacterium]